MESTTTISPTVTLNNGVKMPRMGLGTYKMDNLANVVYESIKDGVRMIDTAYVYENETEVGEGINKAISEGIVKREEVFVTTKIWYNDKHDPEAGIKKSLKNLNLEYVDLYLDHWPVSHCEQDGVSKYTPIHVFWRNMEDLVRKGYTKSIGVSNYNVQLLNDLLSYCEIKPVVNQVEFHPYNVQENLNKFCRDNGIYVTAYNSLTRGHYEARDICKQIDLIKEPIIVELATKYGKTPGNIALNWALVQDVLVIPATSNPRRMKENLESFSFRLSDEDVKKISALNCNLRFIEKFKFSVDSAFKEGLNTFD